MNEFLLPKQVATAVNSIKARTSKTPAIGLVLGSGLSGLADAIENADIIPYEEIEGWPTATVVGHSGKLVIGELEGKTVLAQQGRAHYYEGYPLKDIILAVRVMHALGIKTIIVTNAAGGINRRFTPGDLMLITDHINFPGLAGENPLRGPNDDAIGPRFVDLTETYDKELRQVARDAAKADGFTLQEGTYAFVGGPSFETPAELRFLHTVGADAVGMSTVPTVITARHAGMRVLGISSITNKAILNPVEGDEVSHEEVLETGKIIVPRLTALIRGVLAAI